MPAHHPRWARHAAVMTTGRRQAMSGLLAGATAMLHDPTGAIEAKGKKKKKKCKKPNRCPERHCCTCRDPNTFVVVLCDYIASSDSFLEDCTTFCESHGLDLRHASGGVPEQANYCDHSLQCVRLDCPVT